MPNREVIKERVIVKDATIESRGAESAVAVINVIVNIVLAILLIRFVLKLLGANAETVFVSFWYAMTRPLVVPFFGIFPELSQNIFVIEWATVIAILVYALIGYAFVRILRSI